MTALPADLVTFLAADAAPPEDVDTIEALAALWLANHREADRDTDDLPWSAQCVFELDRYPELLWQFCVMALDLAENRWQVTLLAAGPLEDLIARDGAEFIDRIEELARRSARFRYALSGVWPQGKGATATWKRVEAARAAGMAQGIDTDTPLPPA